MFLGPMLFSIRLPPAVLPGWLSLVRPREGSHSAGLIIWFETSGGSGTEEAPLTVPEHHSLDQVTYLCKRQDRSQGDRDRFSPPGFDVAFFGELVESQSRLYSPRMIIALSCWMATERVQFCLREGSVHLTNLLTPF